MPESLSPPASTDESVAASGLTAAPASKDAGESMLRSLEVSVAVPSRTASDVPASLVAEASGPPSPPPGGGGQVAVSKQSCAGKQFGRSVRTATARKERLW